MKYFYWIDKKNSQKFPFKKLKIGPIEIEYRLTIWKKKHFHRLKFFQSLREKLVGFLCLSKLFFLWELFFQEEFIKGKNKTKWNRKLISKSRYNLKTIHFIEKKIKHFSIANIYFASKMIINIFFVQISMFSKKKTLFQKFIHP